MPRIYYIWGEEQYLVDEEINLIADKIENSWGGTPEVIYLDGDELTPAQLRERLEFSPLFFHHRLVVIKRPSWIEKIKVNQHIYQVIDDYCSRDNEGQTLVITAVKPNNSNPVVKLLGKNAVTIGCKKPDSRYLEKWLNEQARLVNCTLTREALALLIKSGQDLYYLQNLMGKLSLMIEGTVLDKEAVEQELEINQEVKIFKLTDALLIRDPEAALQSLNQLMLQGEHPVYVLFMMVKEFFNLGKVKGFYEAGLKSQEIAEATGLQEFRIKKLLSYQNRFTWSELRNLFQGFLETDIRFKSSGQDEKTILEALIIEACTKKQNLPNDRPMFTG
ncbi:MAG: DNA polymerase III subunit delta [Syntrophomonadaceae bacterium]|nr:DNA polymerase III subunit delta [Syntrophomonadaceae bacterium]